MRELSRSRARSRNCQPRSAILETVVEPVRSSAAKYRLPIARVLGCQLVRGMAGPQPMSRTVCVLHRSSKLFSVAHRSNGLVIQSQAYLSAYASGKIIGHSVLIETVHLRVASKVNVRTQASRRSSGCNALGLVLAPFPAQGSCDCRAPVRELLG